MEQTKDITIAKHILRNRLSQMIVNEKYKAGLFKIPIHLAMGHEAIAVALDSIMEEQDQLVCSHRNIHYNLARTRALEPILNEYLLKEEGLAQGQLGSMNLANEARNVAYTSSILGNNLPVAVGLALSQKVKKSNGLVVVVTGDGAMEEGTFYESLLFLKSNGLSALVIVENNEWSMATKIDERRYDMDVPKLAASLGAEHERLSGNDPYQYMERLKEIKKKALETPVSVVLQVDVTTLGGQYVQDEQNGGERFINYHAGPASEINLTEWPEIEHSSSDPVFVLQEHFALEDLQKMSKEILRELQEEIHES
jgi:TPP-dependent pyruvate/acetoin dehydrogenase alpha subunit